MPMRCAKGAADRPLSGAREEGQEEAVVEGVTEEEGEEPGSGER